MNDELRSEYNLNTLLKNGVRGKYVSTNHALLSDREKLEDYLDYLHIQSVKKQSTHRFSLDEVKEILANTDSDS